MTLTEAVLKDHVFIDFGSEVMTQDELSVMDGGKYILQLRGLRPFLSDKYDITRHPYYKYTSDFDPRNAFDIEKHLLTKLRPKADEACESYDVGTVDGVEPIVTWTDRKRSPVQSGRTR